MRHRYAFLLVIILVSNTLLLTGDIAAQQPNVLLNGDFETGDLTGWQVTGDVVVVTDSLDTYTVGSLHSVGEGIYAARIGDEIAWAVAGPQMSSIAQEFIVPKSDGLLDEVVLQFAYAVVANDPPSHVETDKPAFRVNVVDLTTQEALYDTDVVFTSQTSGKWYLGAGPNGLPLDPVFAFGSGDRWVFQAWTPVEIDLKGREDHQVRVDFTVRDCNPTAHAAYGYLDAIYVGKPKSVDLAPLEGDPQLAPFLKPNLLGKLFGVGEGLGSLWWLLCCLLPLILLALLGSLLFWRATRPKYDGGGWTPPPRDPRPPGNGSGYSGGGGILLPDEKKSKPQAGGIRLPDDF